VSDTDSRARQYAGLALVIIAYVGGIIGWSWATLTVDPDPAASDTTQTRVEPFNETTAPAAGSETPDAP
jgi:hypothetical protein